VYAPGADGTGQARILLKANGNIALYTTKGNAAGGSSVTIQANADGTVHIGSEFGGVSITDGKISMLSASGSGVEMSAAGMTLVGQTITANGSVVLGDASATGVATQASLGPLLAALVAQNTALMAMLGPANPLVSLIDGGNTLGTAFVTAATATSALALLPATFSLSTKAS
jgi:hypothetical protein